MSSPAQHQEAIYLTFYPRSTTMASFFVTFVPSSTLLLLVYMVTFALTRSLLKRSGIFKEKNGT